MMMNATKRKQMKKYRIISHPYAISVNNILPSSKIKERERERKERPYMFPPSAASSRYNSAKTLQVTDQERKKMKASPVTVLGTRRGGGPCNKYLLFAISGGGSQVAASQKNDQDVSVWETRYEKRRGYYSITKWIKTEAQIIRNNCTVKL